jgi:CubicO group peptidase (beta-lactamase class C family)
MWKDRQIVSPQWIKMARTPGPANAEYGFANWYLNTNRRPLPSAPESAVRFVGNGSNIVYIDWDNDLVVVFRWIRGGPALDQIIGKIIAATRTAPSAGVPDEEPSSMSRERASQR